MESLHEIPLFAPLDAAEAMRRARGCFWKDYGPHELVLDLDDEPTDVRFVLSGRVRIIGRFAVGKEMILNEMGAGDYFGEIAAIDGSGRSASVITLERSRLCIMPQKLFLEILADNKDVALEVMRMLARRVRRLNLQVAEHSFLQARHRLYAELLRLARPRPGQPSQRSISPPPVQRELAERIGSRREVVSREVASLEREGVLDKTRGALIIVKPGELQHRISEAWES